jgi:hypothetical protein
MHKKYLVFSLAVIFFFCCQELFASVILRDSTVTWQHHRFTLNANYSMASMTKDNNDIVQVQFQGKVIENEFFRIVLIPEYGGRVLSYFYKPTSHEYLYQSACGTPYGIGENNFYYNWLMVYGGIFPTFPESEHGKTWLKSWEYQIIKNTADTVLVSMSLVDNTEFSGRPGQFNNGITGIKCDVIVGVYSGRADFSFDVKLTNPSSSSKKYEYWTCTTLTPGCEPGNTYSPLNSEIIVPAEKYEAAWSPGSWIGSYGTWYDFSRVNFLSKWTDMGIGYVRNLTDDYWGVINHTNTEGFFRISDRFVTKGLKLWTWGKNAATANPFLISNGGRDDYIELWGGVPVHFFDDAQMAGNSQLAWSETYFPTIALKGVTSMNTSGGVFMDLVSDGKGFYNLETDFFLTNLNKTHTVDFYINDETGLPVLSESFVANPLGNNINQNLGQTYFSDGTNQLTAKLRNQEGSVLLTARKAFDIIKTNLKLVELEDFGVQLIQSGLRTIEFKIPKNQRGYLQIFTVDGRQLYTGDLFDGKQVDLQGRGVYMIRMTIQNNTFTEKIVIK